jgi:hypothetical protein
MMPEDLVFRLSLSYRAILSSMKKVVTLITRLLVCVDDSRTHTDRSRVRWFVSSECTQSYLRRGPTLDQPTEEDRV